MLIRKLLVVGGLLCLFVFATRANAAISLSDVKINGTIDATAAAGIYDGNTEPNIVINLLTSGGEVELWSNTNTFFTFSSLGMFGSAVDTPLGTSLGDVTWTEQGKSDDTANGPFTSNPDTVTGTLTFDTPFSGTFAIALKADGGYAVYAFLNAVDVSYVTFTTEPFANPGNGEANALSHAALYTGDNLEEDDPPHTPEPTSLVIWCLGMVAAGIGARRLRKQK